MASRAAAAAPLVDDKVIAVYQSVSAADRARLRKALDAYGLESVAFWNDLSGFIRAGMLSDQLVRTRFRYNGAEAVAAIDGLRKKGFLIDNEASPHFAKLAELAAAILHETATSCWEDTDLVFTVAAGASRILVGAAGPLVDAYLQLPEPEAPAPRLLHRMVGLRYARADAHAAAWMDAGLEAESIVALTKAWQGGQEKAPALVLSGLVTDDGEITELGRQVRNEIEQDTNALIEPAFAGLDDDEWAGWLDALAAL